ncbi:MAG: isopentenyl transferase family protein, partial [Devosia sp.]
MLIAGPTASGKSALALRRAAAAGGVVINADAMQVYDVLRVVTARPAPEDMGNVPHRLYGSVPPSRRFSTGDWLRAVKALLDDPEVAGRELIFVGGTGLYFEALVNGFAEAELVGLDREQRGKLIAARDPLIAARLKAPDPQRVARALAVLNATGRSLARFQDDVQAGLLGGFE